MSHKYTKPIVKQEKPKEREIVFSLKKLDINDYFNIDCTCPNWSSDLMRMMQSISQLKLSDFKTNTGLRGSKYRIHNHKNANPPVSLPNKVDVKLDDMLQIRIEKNKGGIHGYLVENTFYVVWLDPLHNMYPNERYGGLKKIKSPTTCCGWNDEELKRLQKENVDYQDLLSYDE